MANGGVNTLMKNLGKEYIHYGHTLFDQDIFQPVKNQEWGAAKPLGGFWASPVDAERSWKNWCEDEEFRLENLNTSFRFHLKDDARVFHIYRSDQLQQLPELDTIIKVTWYCIDFEKAAENWDAIELHLSEEICDDYLESLYFRLYGWDCDSILIMNPEIIYNV